MKHKEPKWGFLTLVFTVLVVIVEVISLSITMGIFWIMYHIGIITRHNVLIPVLALILFSVLSGAVMAFFFSRKPLQPINILLNGLKNLAKGKYGTRLLLKDMGYGAQIAESFNSLAEELENTEMFRSDFVNNFSHEFKTPIVSIKGFAKLIQKGNISKEQEEEYIDIIVEESTRLSDMATKVLSLTKLENQSILNDISSFNLSEQLRTCILLLEKKWTKKNLIISADFREYIILANEEMLKQVWINLLDNAIKFCEDGGEVAVLIEQKNKKLIVTITNTGSKISEKDQKRIFQKFYQSDESHASEGTGIGLTIVKRVIELHKGEIKVECKEDLTKFIVALCSEEK